MKTILHLEELLMFAFTFFLFSRLDSFWELFTRVLFAYSSFNRAFRYSLMHEDVFQNTLFG